MAILLLLFTLFFVVKSDETCDIEIENTLKTLLTPQDYPTMQLQALRRDILRKFQEAIEKVEADDDMNYKRSLSSLAQSNNLPGKRNLEALARAGLIRTLPEPEEEDINTKRSIANLAKNGQLPPVYQNNESKRGIESLARNGELYPRRDIQELLDELYNKRNIGSLARNFNFPAYGKRYLASLVRSGGQQYSGKRNVAALARDGVRFTGKRGLDPLIADEFEDAANKRNIASIKAQYSGRKKRATRTKRDIGYFDADNGEYPAPVYQNQNGDDYEELLNAVNVFPTSDKRFLGSVAKSGWFRPSSMPEKRHIGALARLGWLPTLRNVRRFNRSGRSTKGDSCRETSTNGQAEDDTFTEENEVSLDNKRFLLQPAVDQILLRRMYMMHPRTHPFLSDMS